MVEGFAEGIDDGNPVEVVFVLGWLDGDAEIEGLALGNVRCRWDWSCRRLCELEEVRNLLLWERLLRLLMMPHAAVRMHKDDCCLLHFVCGC